MKRKWALKIAFILPLIPWFITAGYFYFPRFSEFSDLAISHLPNALHLLESIHNYGQIPLWSNAILGGFPFSSNPLAGLWYPPGWLAYLFSFPFGFNLIVLVHILWGGWGMLAWLQRSGLKDSAAVVGAVSFMLMPKVFAHFGAGHISLIYAICWTPWLLLAERDRIETRKWWLTAGVLGLIALADIRWFAYAFLLWGGYSLWMYISRNMGRITWQNASGWVFSSSGVVFLALTLALILIMPLIEYSQQSTRALMTGSDNLKYSLPIEELLGLWVPDFGGFAEWTLYPGSLVFFLTIYCICIPEVRKKCAFWLVILGGGILVSLGDQIPGMDILARLPGFDLLRVPTRFYFLSGIAFSIIAGKALDDLLGREHIHRPDPVFFMSPFGAFVLFIAAGLFLMRVDIAPNLVWALGCFSFTIVLLSVAQRKRTWIRWVGYVFPLFLIIDLSGVNAQSLSVLPARLVYSQGRSVAEFVANQAGNFRIYTPSNSIPQHTAAEHGLRMANGIDPLQLQSYYGYVLEASGVEHVGYSVTLPPLEGENISTVNQNAIPDLDQLGFLAVRYVVSEFPITVEDLRLVFQDGNTRVYENSAYLPWVRIQMDDQTMRAVESYEMRPGKYQIVVNGPGLLTVADVDYTGWKVYINGVEAQKIRMANVALGVKVPPGEHQIEFKYHLVSLTAGAVVSAVAWFGLVIVMIFSTKGEKKSS